MVFKSFISADKRQRFARVLGIFFLTSFKRALDGMALKVASY